MCSRRSLVASLLLSLCSLVSFVSLAQPAPYDAFPDLWVTDDTVLSLDVVGDTLYLAGDFEYVGPPTGQLAVLDKTTGEPDLRLPRVGAAGAAAGIVQTVIPDGQGGYYVGGDFHFVGSEPRYNLAHVLADGTLDPAFQPNPVVGTDPIPFGRVSALVLGDGVLYVGGQFVTVDGEPREDLAALDAETGAILPFDAVLSGGPPYPQSIYGVTDLVVKDGVVYVGGNFTHVAGQPRPNAVALDAETGALLSWGASPNDTATPVAVADSTLYLYGNFTAINGQPRQPLAEVTLYDETTGGGAVTAWEPEEPVYGDDFVLTPTDLWAADSYDGGHPLVRIDRETGAVETFQVSGELRFGRALAFDPEGGPSGEGTLYLGCTRLFEGFYPFPVVVGVDPATGEATGYEILAAPGDYGTDYVGALAVEPGPDGRLFAGGTVVSIGGERRGGLAALDLTTGRALPPFNGEIGPSLLDVGASPDGRAVYFSSVGSLGVLDVETWSIREFGGPGAARPSRARPQAPLHGAPRLLGGESAFAVTEDRVYFCPGGCEAYDRQTENLLWVTPAVVVLGFGRPRRALLLDGPGGPGGDGGTLFLSGPIVEIPLGQEQSAFAALDPQTGEVLDWDVGVELSVPGGALGTAIAWLDRDGEGPTAPVLYLGGENIYQVQGQERDDLLAVDPETAALLPWNPGEFLTTASGGAMAAQRTEGGGIVYVRGGFRFEVGGELYPLLAFDAATAEPLPEWRPAVGGGTMVLSERHEALFLGGDFQNSLHGSGHAYLVALTPAAPILPTAGEPSPEAPATAALSAAYPNPFSETASLTLTLPEAERVEVVLYDVLGRRVAVLHDGPLAAGTHTLTVEGSGLPTGVYVVRARGEAFTVSRRVTVVR